MRKSADVKSVPVLREAKAALVEFRETAGGALAEANSDVQRTLSWLQNEKRTFWDHEVRRRREKVNQARSDLYRAKLAAMDEQASCLEQKKMLERSERGLEEAIRKVDSVRKWSRMLERELMLFKGKCQAVARAVEGDLPRGEARLDVLMDRLEAYLRIATETSASSPPPAAPEPGSESEIDPAEASASSETPEGAS